MENTKNLVIIPTYNEKENINNIIHAVLETFDTDILIIDDGSPDGTAEIVKSLIQNEFKENLFIAERQKKSGLGTAYVHGFKWGIERNYEFIFEMDADFSHNPKDLQRLYDACIQQNADLVIGSRYAQGVNVLNWPMPRLLMSYYGSMYVRFMLGIPVKDTTAGFKCYRVAALKNIDFSKIHHTGYGFQIEMKFKMYQHAYKIIEIPIIFKDRTLGTSKMSSGILKEAIFGVIGLKIRSWFSRN